jgi:hypothetical protein
MKQTMVRSFPQMRLRVSQDLKLKIEQSAKMGNRTLNSEICYQLEIAYGIKSKEQEVI